MGDRIVVMKDGMIQQVDTPQNLYNNPCNKFVAGFIGSPQMNFLEAVVEKEGEDFALVFGEHRIHVRKPEAGLLRGQKGDLRHPAGGYPCGGVLPVHVRGIQYSGQGESGGNDGLRDLPLSDLQRTENRGPRALPHRNQGG